VLEDALGVHDFTVLIEDVGEDGETKRLSVTAVPSG
jgi:hypothetical protein